MDYPFESHQIAKTFVSYEEEWFYVSTANVKYSDGSVMYSETVVWKFDMQNDKRIGCPILQSDGPKGCIQYHLDFVKFLRKFGSSKEIQV